MRPLTPLGAGTSQPHPTAQQEGQRPHPAEAQAAQEQEPSMTTTATSASDRIEAAREALADYDGNETNYRAIPVNEQGGRHQEYYENAIFDNAHVLATTLRALIEPPATVETPDQIAERIVNEYGMAGRHRSALTAAVNAGIQAAWNDWEPSDNLEGATNGHA